MRDKPLHVSDIAAETGCSRAAARVRAHRRARRGELERLARGIYVQPAEGRSRGGPPFDLVALLAPGAVVSHGSACALHGIGPDPGAVVASWGGRRRVVRTTRGTILLLPDTRRLATTTVALDGTEVLVRSLEAAIIDAVEAPRHAGGLAAVLRILGRAVPRVRWEEVSRDLETRGVSALAQRLGLLLDALGLLDSGRRATIRRHVRPGIKVHLGPRGGGRLDVSWNVVVNVPLPRPAPRSPARAAEEPPGELPVALL